MLFFEVDVAHQWYITPDEYFAKPSYIKALMAAHVVAKNKMPRVDQKMGRK